MIKKVLLCFCLLISITALTGCNINNTTPLQTAPQEDVNEVQTYTFASNFEYEIMLHSLGYTEFFADYHRDSASDLYPCSFTKMTSENNITSLTFSYLMPSTGSPTEWTMRAKKDNGIKNMFSEMDCTDTVTQIENSSFRQVSIYSCSTQQHPPVYIIYYPDTGNLYNFIPNNTNIDEKLSCPRVLLEYNGDKQIYDSEHSQFEVVNGVPIEIASFSIQNGETKKTYSYRVGMTLATWASSSFNNGDWLIGNYNTLFSKDGQYVIENIQTDIRLLLNRQKTIIALETNEDYQQRSEDALIFFNSQYVPSVFVQMVNHTTPLISSGIKIENKYTITDDYVMAHAGALYLQNETIKIYLKNVDDAIIDDLKLYVFNEPLEILDIIYQDGLVQLLSQESLEILSTIDIPQESNSFSFKRGEDVYFNYAEDKYQLLDEKVVSAECAIYSDFVLDRENVFAIAYKDQIVYWIHVPTFITIDSIFDVTKIIIEEQEDGSYVLSSDIYTEQELLEFKEILDTDINLYNSIFQSDTPELNSINDGHNHNH